jgi:hypothetical protein
MSRFTPVGTIVPGVVMPTAAFQKRASIPAPAPAVAAVAVDEDDESMVEWNQTKTLLLSNAVADQIIAFFSTTDYTTGRKAIVKACLLALMIHQRRSVKKDKRVGFMLHISSFLHSRRQVDPKLRASKDSLGRKVVNIIVDNFDNNNEIGPKLRESVYVAYQTWRRQVDAINGSAEPQARRQQFTSQ